MKRVVAALGLAAAVAVATAGSTQAVRPVPYWASLAAGDALMRTGPGREYPAVWRYRRIDMPVKVVAVHTNWRKVQEVDGTTGWMASVLLRDKRTAIVKDMVASLRASPAADARILWRAEPGVIGMIDQCSAGWCHFDAHGKAGYVEVGRIWGVDAGETVD